MLGITLAEPTPGPTAHKHCFLAKAGILHRTYCPSESSADLSSPTYVQVSNNTGQVPNLRLSRVSSFCVCGCVHFAEASVDYVLLDLDFLLLIMNVLFFG